MSKYATMTIPDDADGIVDDEKAFNKQKKANEAKLKEELSEAGELESGLRYEDLEMTFVPRIENGSYVKLAKRRSVLSRRGGRLTQIANLLFS